MLKLIKEIKEEGLKTVINKYGLIVRYIDDKVLLKYHAINSIPYKYVDACREARGIILEMNTWKVYSFGFRRFFNLNEVEDHGFNWLSFDVLKKKDGSLISLYWDWYNEMWQAATTGTIYGDAQLDDNGITFRELFWNTIDIDTTKLNKDYVYNFELCTPFNQVVVYHSDAHVSLLSVKDRTQIDNGCFGELSRSEVESIADLIGVDVVEKYSFTSKEDLIDFVHSEDGSSFEGVVLVDDNFNRIKLKNLIYCELHHNMTNINDVALFKILLTGEGDEVIANFPHLKDRLDELTNSFNTFLEVVNLFIAIYSKLTFLEKKVFYSLWLKDKKHLSVVNGVVERIVWGEPIEALDEKIKSLEKNDLKRLIKHFDANFYRENKIIK